MSDHPIPDVHVRGRILSPDQVCAPDSPSGPSQGRLSRSQGRLSRSQGYTYSVLVKFFKITTGRRTITSTPISVLRPINFSLRSCDYHHIIWQLHNKLNTDDYWLCDYLAPKISTAAIDYGFGHNSFELTVNVILTYPYVPVVPVPSLSNTKTSSKVLRRMVRLGMKAEELKSLNMETESCSICLENLVSGSKRPTRMSCSHVFLDGCLLPWLYRKNTCPLCRTELY